MSLYRSLKMRQAICLGELIAPVPFENGQLGCKTKVVREPKSLIGYGNTVPSMNR